MNIIENKVYDEERSLYNLKNSQVINCTFAGEKDGESVLKEARNIEVINCNFELRYPLWHVDGFLLKDSTLTDLSRAPLWYCKNGQINNVEINFFKKDILKENIDEKYDFLISNPPYVKKDEYTSIETKYEPGFALYANNNGLEFYERILNLSKDILNENGMIIFEIGATLGNNIKKIALSIYPKANITIEKDYNNFDRFMFIET